MGRKEEVIKKPEPKEGPEFLPETTDKLKPKPENERTKPPPTPGFHKEHMDD